MDAVEAIYSASETRITGDSGAGGLAAAGHQKVSTVIRAGDPQRTFPDNRIEVQINPVENDFELGARGIDAVVRFKIVTKRDLGFVKQNAIEERLIARFKDTTALSASGWTFSAPVLLRPAFQTGASDTELEAVVEFMYHLQAA